MNDPKNDIKFVFFDLETTGCPGSGSIYHPFHRIVQISAVSGTEQFDAVVNPECHIPSESTAIHCVSNTMVETAPRFHTIFPQFRAFVKKRKLQRNTRIVLVAHNALGFDKILLEKECQRCGFKMPADWCFYDTLLTYRREFADLPSKKLGDLFQNRFGEPITNAHNSLSDTLALQRLFNHEIQNLFSMADTVPTAVHYYTPNNAPVQTLRGIGDYTARSVSLLLGKNAPTVGDLRAYCAGQTLQDVERILRLKLHCSRETFLFSLLCETVQCSNPNELFACFPFAIGAFPGIPESAVQQLAAMGLRSPEYVKRYYLFQLRESSQDWDQLMRTIGCEPFRMGMILRRL